MLKKVISVRDQHIFKISQSTNEGSTVNHNNDELTLLDLADEILMLIFEELSQTDPHAVIMVIPAVCKRWQGVSETLVTMAQPLTLTLYDPLKVSNGTKSNIKAIASRVKRPLIELEFNRSGPKTGDLLKVLDTIDARTCRLDFSSVSYNQVTDAVLEKVAEVCPELTELNLYGCSEISNEGLEHVGKLQKLTKLDLWACENITDAGLGKVAEGCPELTKLGLAWCGKITDAGLVHLGQLQSLSSLNLYGCRNISNAGLNYLRQIQKLTELNLE